MFFFTHMSKKFEQLNFQSNSHLGGWQYFELTNKHDKILACEQALYVICTAHNACFNSSCCHPPSLGNLRVFARQKFLGVGKFIDRLVAGVGVGNISNYGIYYIMLACDGLDLISLQSCEKLFPAISIKDGDRI